MMAKIAEGEKPPKRTPRIWYRIYALERLYDPRLRACSRNAQSFYNDLEAYTYLHSEPRGFLTLPNGKPLRLPAEIAPHIPGPHTVKEISCWLEELVETAALARHPDNGIIELPLILEMFEKQAAEAERQRKSREKKADASNA